MAFHHGKGTHFELDNTSGTLTDISSWTDTADLARTLDTGETTTFGSDNRTFIVGLATATVSLGGKYDPAVAAALTPGSQVPMHDHPHEQMGVVLEGEFVMVIGGESRTIRTGDKYVIPGGVQHGVTEVMTRSVALDIFSPPREDYA